MCVAVLCVMKSEEMGVVVLCVVRVRRCALRVERGVVCCVWCVVSVATAKKKGVVLVVCVVCFVACVCVCWEASLSSLAGY